MPWNENSEAPLAFYWSGVYFVAESHAGAQNFLEPLVLELEFGSANKDFKMYAKGGNAKIVSLTIYPFSDD